MREEYCLIHFNEDDHGKRLGEDKKYEEWFLTSNVGYSGEMDYSGDLS